MLEEGPDGFEGGMSAKKYMTITGASKATATRDKTWSRSISSLPPAAAGARITRLIYSHILATDYTYPHWRTVNENHGKEMGK